MSRSASLDAVAGLAGWLRRLGRAAAEPRGLQGDPRRVPPDGPAGPIDVIVPVHGAAAALERCLRSLFAQTDLARHRLVLVLDGPQPAEVEALVTPAALGESVAGVTVLRQPQRRGFVAAVNAGMTLGAAADDRQPPEAASAAGSPRSNCRDVVLLNSDTQVTAGWIDKLQAAARSAPEIATVTPFSNTATICSLPRFLAANALPAGWDVERFGRLVEERSQRRRPRLPTGVGVCLYIKRKALEQLGLFDEASFGLGYGEESEFCMRALKAGYCHVLDDATFIYHEGHRSFGTSRRRRVDAAHRRLAALHPEYMATVARFVRQDPLAPIRQRVVAALVPTRAGGAGRRLAESGAAPSGAPAGAPERVLHVVHGWPPWSPAGTEMYAAWLARRQAAHREVTVVARIADPAMGLGDAIELLDEGARVRLLVRNFDERDPRSRNAIANREIERDFARLLRETRPELVHVHHLAGLAASVVGVARRHGVPVIYQVQDWWTPCARANLLDARRRLCSGPAPGKCAACLPLTGLPPAALLNRLLYLDRNRATRHALRGAAAFVMGSRFIHDSYRSLGLLREADAVHVVEYGIETPPAQRRTARDPGQPLRFGVIGSILPHKGIHVAVAAFAGIDPRRAQLTVWGDPAIDPSYTRELLTAGAALAPGSAAPPERNAACSRPTVCLAGRFAEPDKAAIFAGIDVLLIPSLGLESFGLVAREAMHHGVPVIASRRGALTEIFPAGEPGDQAAARSGDAATGYVGVVAGYGDDSAAGPSDPATGESGGKPFGALFEPGDPAALRHWIDRLIAEPSLLATWQCRLPSVKSADRHAEEIEQIYVQVLADLHQAGRGRRATGGRAR